MFFVKFQEPIKPEHSIIKFCEDSGLPIALDETIDAIQGDFVNHLKKYAHPGIAAIVSFFFQLLIFLCFLVLRRNFCCY
jgi:O-succinylbenzoate synthase